MSSNTPNLGLLKKDPMVDGNETFNIETMLNENWDKVDEAVGQVREELGNIDVDIPEASLTEKGIVQLSSATNGTRENVAATEKAVKAAYDEALAGKQLGVEQKANVVAALNSIGVVASTSESWAQLVAKMAGIIKSTGNATAGDVLAGRTFSNGSGNGVVGTMPNRSAENNHMPGLETTVWTGDRAFIRPPAGYYNGSTWVTAPALDFIPENIREGRSLLGVAGTLRPSQKGSTTTSFRDSGTASVIRSYSDIATLPKGISYISIFSKPGTQYNRSKISVQALGINLWVTLEIVDANGTGIPLVQAYSSQYSSSEWSTKYLFMTILDFSSRKFLTQVNDISNEVYPFPFSINNIPENFDTNAGPVKLRLWHQVINGATSVDYNAGCESDIYYS
ncbi:phage tail protein [Paenibacillus sp. FSL H8-0457]|uniref:tail fiber protein n=1 Tax=unclassified Paenibacillus TaxID=185978 RepID=UPI0003E2638D|nr:phage tail protein [Paenibacillus sp. FSL H8-457]ETT58699.1 phage-related putative tail protein [Paenibacillus sp. FSL H8-457]